MTVQERERRNEEAEYRTETMKEREIDRHDTESRPRGIYRTSVNNLRGSDLLFHPQLRESRSSVSTMTIVKITSVHRSLTEAAVNANVVT